MEKLLRQISHDHFTATFRTEKKEQERCEDRAYTFMNAEYEDEISNAAQEQRRGKNPDKEC